MVSTRSGASTSRASPEELRPLDKFRLLKAVELGRPGAGEAQPEEGPTYRVAYAADGVRHRAGVHTCYDLFTASVERWPDNPCLGTREVQPDGSMGPYRYLSYREVAALTAKAGSAFAALGLAPKDRLGILGPNSIEWMVAMQGCNRMSLQAVPLYDTLGESAVAYVIRHSETKFVVAAGSKLAALAKALPALQGPLLGVAYWGEAPEAAKKAVEAAGVALHSWESLLALGEQRPAKPVPPRADDLCTIMYTSGTTGNPKGVMHTHGGVLTCVEAMTAYLDENRMDLHPRDVYFSFLTLAHIFDRIVEEAVLFLGASIGYYSGDTRRLLEDAAACRPTVFAGVPRVYERVTAGVMDKVKKAGPVSLALFKAALAYKKFWMRLGWSTERASPLANRLFFSKTKAAVGGRVRLMISGGAPLPKYACEFMEVAMCVPVVQGYGLTESCAASFVQFPNKNSQVGTVGPPMPGVDVRLEAVPELGHLPSGAVPRGEVCIKGPAMFKGYYKQPELTAEVVDADGFFHTGDIGEFTREGSLLIIDRKKNIFKLSQGEYVAVEFLESAFGKCDMVEQVWLYGSSYESCLVAVVVPVKHAALAWAKAQGGALAGLEYEELCASPEARAWALEALTATGKEAKLKGFEFPKAVHLEPHAWVPEADLVTPKLSLKRPQLLKHYAAQVDRMYADLKTAGKAASSKRPAAAAPPAGPVPARA